MRTKNWIEEHNSTKGSSMWISSIGDSMNVGRHSQLGKRYFVHWHLQQSSIQPSSLTIGDAHICNESPLLIQGKLRFQILKHFGCCPANIFPKQIIHIISFEPITSKASANSFHELSMTSVSIDVIGELGSEKRIGWYCLNRRQQTVDNKNILLDDRNSCKLGVSKLCLLHLIFYIFIKNNFPNAQ